MSIVKFLLNTAIAGAVAGGVYYYLDQNAKRNAANADDPDEAPGALDKENIKDAADRAYTSIVHGTEEVTESIKQAVGPQGEQIISDVQEAAGKVHETVTYAGKKVGDIVVDPDSDLEEKASAVADTVRYAAVDLADKLRQLPNAAEPDEFEEDDEEETATAEAYAEPAQEQDVTPAEDAEDDDPDIEVEFYVDDQEATETSETVVAEAVPVTEPAQEAAPAKTPAETEVAATPVTDAAQIEEFFDEDDSKN